jgi:hypothetical protein
MEYSVVLVEQLYGKEKADEVAGPMVGINFQHFIHPFSYSRNFCTKNVLVFAVLSCSLTVSCCFLMVK